MVRQSSAVWFRFMAFAGIAGMVVFVGGCGARGAAKTSSGAPDQPVFVINTMSQDAGRVWQGLKVPFRFVVRNTGARELKIQVQPTCGCTVANFDSVIPAGGKGKVVAELNTKAMAGKVVKEVTVTTNDPLKPSLQLTLKADITPLVEIQPSNTVYFDAWKGYPTTREVTLIRAEGKPLTVLGATASQPYLTVANTPLPPSPLGQKRLPPGQTDRVKVTLTLTGKAPRGNFSGTVDMKTNETRISTMQLIVTGLVHDEISMQPLQVFFGAVDPHPAKPVTRDMTVTKRAGHFRITNVKVDGPPLTVKMDSHDNGRVWIVHFIYKGGWTPGPVSGIITMSTDYGPQSRLISGFTGIVSHPQSTKGGS